MHSLPADFLESLTVAIEARSGKHKGAEIIFTCPSHEDEHPSARYNVKKAVWTCDPCGGGGGALDLAKLLGVCLPEREAKVALRLSELAEAKGLDVDLLKSWGVRDGRRYNSPAVVIPYFGAEGEVLSERYRVSLSKPPISGKGDKPRLYGLDRLKPGPVLNAVGVPGANTWRAEWTQSLAGRDIYLWREPDTGGDTLAEKVSTSIPGVRIIEAPDDAKYASELWLLTRDREAFVERRGRATRRSGRPS